MNIRAPILVVCFHRLSLGEFFIPQLAALAVAALLLPVASHAAPPDKSGVKPSVLSLPSGAGSIEGLGESFEPQLNTGGSSYGVSISVPPGRAGLAPSIRLGYNSFSGNGLAGVGWSLEFNSVKRQTDKGFPEYDSGDTFVFGGEELVPLNNAGQDWRCENERNFQRLRRIDSDADGAPDAWEVTERNGTKHTLGRFRGQNNRWSVVEHPELPSAQPFDRTYCWHLDSTTDLHGNRIEYEYIRGTGILYPSRITYAHLSNNFHEVTFQYEARPDAFDDYRPAFSARLNRRLSRIEVRTQGQLVRAYNFAYSYEPGDLLPAEVALQSTYLDLGITLLKRVVQVDRSGNDANYLPPLVFTYSGLDLTKAEQRGFSSPPELDLAEPNGRVQLADLDGDALPDLFATTAEGAAKVQRVALNRGESRLSGQPRLTFAPAKLVLSSSPVDLAEPNTVVHDPKGKGLVDLSSLQDEGGNKRLETFGNRARLDLVDEDRLGFSQENLEATVLANPPAFVTYSQAATRQMDVNFDKRGDFVNLEPGFGTMTVNTFFIDRSGNWIAGESSLPPSYPLANTFQDANGNPNPCVHLADMNGDRLLDLVCLAPSPSGAGQRIRVSYWPLCGRGRYADERLIPTTEPDTFEIANADLRDVFLDDITGDGLADVLVLDGSGPETVLSLRVNIAGQRWSPPYTRTGLPRYAPRDPANPTIVRLADLNANGSLDILFRNTAPQDTWTYVELLPQGAPSLMMGIDNGLGKRTAIVYGSAAEDEQLAREAGYAWTTFAPIPLQVVRQIRSSSGLDLNGDGQVDTAVAEFRYRDPYYDGFEREFRGFAFAQRIDYGDDFLFDPVTGFMQVSTGWDTARTPTGQRSGPSLVTRYRFHTGAADQRDNDDYVDQPPPDRQIDEITEVGGREEEALKGLKWVEEQVDPVVLHSALDGGFDAGCQAATTAPTLEGQGRLTPDAYVYTRMRQEWTIRRLYRPTEPLPYFADQNADGIFEDYRSSPVAPVPAGRFAPQGVTVLAGSGRSVTFTFVSAQKAEIHDANGLLSAALGYPVIAAASTTKVFDYDDYGNQTVLRDLGLDNTAYDDERVTTTTYAQGGNALSLWVINRPDIINTTDESGAFVAKKIHYYDGDPFVGVQGQIQSRALLHRTVEHIDATRTINATRTKFDVFGNTEETRDAVGNTRLLAYDPVFRTHPVTETMVVGSGSPNLIIEAEYDYGFGVVTLARDFNGNVTAYHYDSFARPVKTVRPGDSADLPTIVYEYQACDPIRGRGFVYNAAGSLTVTAIPQGSASRVITRQREISGQTGQYVTASYSDGAGRDLATIEEGAVPGTWVVKQATSYNLRGQPQSQWLPYQVSSVDVPQYPVLWPAGRPPATDGVNPSIVSTDSFYDPQGREIRTITPPETWGGARREKGTQYVPFRKLRFDEEDLRAGSPHAGTPHINFSDGLGRLIAVEEVVKITDAGAPGPLTTWRTEYGYDLNDRLTRIKDSQGNIKTMSYDGLKRMTGMSDPDRGSLTLIYDDASNIRETIDNKGQTNAYTYDGVNRIKTEDYRNGGPQIYEVEYFYDTAQPGLDKGDGTTFTGTNTKGQIAYVRDESGETHFSYDARARLEQETKRIRDPLHGQLVSYTTRFAYDSADRVTTISYPDGDEVANAYNTRSLLESVSGSSMGSVVGPIVYRPSAQFGSLPFGNGVNTTYAYDPRLRLTSLETINGQAVRLIDNEYTFDGVSNLQSIEDQRNLTGQPDAAQRFNRQSFAYDSLYRLTRAEYPALGTGVPRHVSYGYDRIGNMLSQSSDITHIEKGFSVTDLGSMAYGGAAGRINRIGRLPGDPPGPHALTSVTPVSPSSGEPRSFGYDANGNMTNVGPLQCAWDFKDRLAAVEDDTMRAEYTYDYTDRRIIKRVAYKPSATNAASVITTFYVNKYFEVRDHEQPTKYVFIQGVRAARITGSLSANTRVQRLRLHSGWNLCSLAVTAPDSLRQLTNSSLLNAQAMLLWNPQTRAWRSVVANETLAAGAILWLHAATNGTVAVTGLYTDPTNQIASAGGAFYPGAGLEAWSLRPLLAAHPATAAWHFEAAVQTWQTHMPSFPSSASTFPESIAPGSPVFAALGSSAELEVPDAALRIRYYHQDHLGSSSVITDAAGALVEETAFYPFGDPRFEYRLRGAAEPYKFTQKERDRETGLHYFAARYLTGNLSRFISVDPKYATPGFLTAEELANFTSLPQENNLYAYARNNPLRYADPTGLGVLDFIEDNLWVPFYHDLDELDVGKTVRVSIAAVETAGGAVACVKTAGLGCAVALNGIDDLQAEFRDGRTAKATAVTYVTGSETAGDVADIVISVALGGAQGFQKGGRKLPAEMGNTLPIHHKTVGGLKGTIVSSNVEVVKGLTKSESADSSASSSKTSSSSPAPADPIGLTSSGEDPLTSVAEEQVCYGENE